MKKKLRKNLAEVDSSITFALENARFELNKLKTIDEVRLFVENLFNEKKIDTPCSKEILENLYKMNYLRAIQYLWNVMMAGEGMGTNI